MMTNQEFSIPLNYFHGLISTRNGKAKTKLSFIETNFMLTLLEHIYFITPELGDLTGEGLWKHT